MRDKIIALAMCGLLALTLFACGEKRGTSNDSDISGDEQHQSGSTTNGGSNSSNNSGSSNNGNSNSKNSTANQHITTGNNAKQSDVMGDSALRGNTLNPANGSADRTATWEQMLENGRVHDTDGFLFDGENSHWA